ncbi:MAG: alpha/beta fold hydrolase [Betaproteobacteria bacterium]|jgi:pimeloyl-ACP methyl ester carboxylesterase|nr:alpha/beta fold hydrolase [Betaproteobacteria bacterium]
MTRVQRRGIEIAFEAVGDGPAVVLLHSFLCSGAMWQNQVGPLAAHNRVINIDCRGHGASSRVSRAFNLYDMVEDTLSVLDVLRIDRAAWAGLSIGGMIALRAALRAPDRLSALVLVDTDAGPERLWSRLKYTALGGLVRVCGVRPVLWQIRRQMFGRTTRQRKPDLVAEWVDRFARVDIPSALRTLEALNERDDLFPRLGEINVPALVLVGAEDQSLPPDRSRRLARALPHARLVEIPGAGHLSSLEQPAAVTNAMLDFLQGAEGSSP